MNNIQVNSVLFEKGDISLKVFLATNMNRAGDLVVKQYLCRSVEEMDLLLKEAIRQAHDPYPIETALDDVFFRRDSERCFTENLVYLKFVEDLLRDFVEKNDRVSTSSPELSAYRLDETLYERSDPGVIVLAATHIATSQLVVVKMLKKGFLEYKVNRHLMKAIAQARVYIKTQ